MMKYILLKQTGYNDESSLQYFDDLIGVYKFVCGDLVYDDFDIEDFKPGGVSEYSCVEERIEEAEVCYLIFKNGESSPIVLLDGDEGSWSKFEDFCFTEETIKESRIMKYQQFNEGKKDKFPNVKKMDVDGFIVYVGRDALSNDHLTFNMAQPEDIWFHAKGVPGSHVIIRIRENLPTKEVLNKVAEIAAKNSKSNKDKTTVVYCQRKFVKKEKGMDPGQVRVDYVNAEEIVI